MIQLALVQSSELLHCDSLTDLVHGVGFTLLTGCEAICLAKFLNVEILLGYLIREVCHSLLHRTDLAKNVVSCGPEQGPRLVILAHWPDHVLNLLKLVALNLAPRPRHDRLSELQ